MGTESPNQSPNRGGTGWDVRSVGRSLPSVGCSQSESRASQPGNCQDGLGFAPRGELRAPEQQRCIASVKLPISADLMSCNFVDVQRKLLVSWRGRYLITAKLHGLAGNQSCWDGLMRGGTPRAGLIRVFLITDPRSGEASVLLSWEASRHPVAGDVALGGSAEPLLVHRSLGGEGGSVAERLEEALDEWVAKGLVEPGWRWSAEIWVTPVCDGVASIAEGLGAVQQQWHELTLGGPIGSVSGLMGFDPALGNVLGGIASEIALPGDRWIKGVKRTVQWGGIVIGMAAGHPLVLNACAKSLIHDLVIEQASKQFGKLLVKSDRPWPHAPVAFDLWQHPCSP